MNCEKQIFPSVEFEPKTSCIRGKRLTGRPRGPNDRERITTKLILKYLESISSQNPRFINEYVTTYSESHIHVLMILAQFLYIFFSQAACWTLWLSWRASIPTVRTNVNSTSHHWRPQWLPEISTRARVRLPTWRRSDTSAANWSSWLNSAPRTTSTAFMAIVQISATHSRAMARATEAEGPFNSPDASTTANVERYVCHYMSGGSRSKHSAIKEVNNVLTISQQS